MTMQEINDKVVAIKEMQRLIEEATAEMESLKDELKNELTLCGKDELDTGVYHLRYTQVISKRLDSKKVQEQYPEIYEALSKSSSSRRFTIN